MAIASLASRRIVAGASIIGLFLVTSIVAAILVGPRSEAVEGRPGPPATVVGPDGAPDRVGGPPDVTTTDTYYVVRTEPSAAPLLNLAGLPLILRDVVFLGEIDADHPMSGLANGGLLAAGVFVLVVVACLGTLVYRYDEVER